MVRSKTGSRKHLTDRAVLERVQSILINAAEGRRNIADDRQYRELRKEFNTRPLVTPELVATHPSVDSFTAFIKGIEDRRNRVEWVRADFGPLLRSLKESAPAGIDPSAWTGRQTVKQQAAIVRTIGPSAIAAIDALICEQERRHDNGGPVDPAEEDAIELLRELRGAIDELIRLAEADQPIAHQSKRLAKIAERALQSFTENFRDDARALHTAGSTVAVTAITYALSHWLLGVSEIPSTLFGTAALTGFAAKRARAQPPSSKRASA